MELLQFHLLCTTVAAVSMELAGSIRRLYRKKKGGKRVPQQQDHVDNSAAPCGNPLPLSEVTKTKKTPYTMSDFDLVQVLGRGSYGKVFLAKEIDTKKCYAMKATKKSEMVGWSKAEAAHVEKRILSLGSTFPYLTKLHSTFSDPSHLFYVMEFLNGGTLSHHLRISQTFDLDRARFYAAEISAGLQFLHRNGIIHRDVKPANIVLDREGHCRLIDFGAACENVIPGVTTMSARCGTPYYMAPEVVEYQDYSFEIDWWSVGITCFEMITGKMPFNGGNRQEVFKAILRGYVHFPMNMNGHVLDFISNLLNYRQWDRLGCIEDVRPIRQHPFFQDIDWDKLDKKELEPPFKPLVHGDDDTGNFDSYYSSEPARLSTIDPDLEGPINQVDFRGFTFASP